MVASRPTCIYCGCPADSRDHVPPKSFLERPFPAQLQTVPACSECNRGFSLDEEYFISVVASVSTAPTLVARITEGSVARAFRRSPGLDNRFIRALIPSPDGRIELQ